MNYQYERERDGSDFADYVYDVTTHRWVYKPLPPTAEELEWEIERDIQRQARDEERAAEWDDDVDDGK